MSKIQKVAVLIVCFTAALAGLQAESWFFCPGWDPSPNLTGLSSTRSTVMNSVMVQDYDDGWVDWNEFTAEYNAQGQISCVNEFYRNPDTGQLEFVYRIRMEYRADDRPLHAYLETDIDGSWHTAAEVDYVYVEDRLQAVYYNRIVDGDQVAYWQAHYIYMPNTCILQRVVEFYYFDSGSIPFMKKYEYTWDAGSRPSEIVESSMSDLNEWAETYRNTYMYHNDDQTTHASYLRHLEFGWPFFTRLVTGIQPSLVLENRMYLKSLGDWYEHNRHFYQYGDDVLLNTVSIYEQRYQQGWVEFMRRDYAYENGLPVSETWLRMDYGETELSPNQRFLMGYTQITAAEDPVSPALIGSLRVYPNPFNPSAGISFELKAAGQTEIAVYNLKGQKVRTLLSGHKSAGTHQLNWDGNSDNGTALAAGIYIIRLNSGAETKTVKAVLAK